MRQQLADHLRGPVVGWDERADADVVVGVHAGSLGYNPVGEKICIRIQSGRETRVIMNKAFCKEPDSSLPPTVLRR